MARAGSCAVHSQGMVIDRRVFLLSASAGALAQTPANRIVVGLIGAGNRGRTIARTMKRGPDVHVAAVCDVYEPNLERGLSEAGPGTRAYRNYKQLLDDKEIGAVVIATPEHWHHRMFLDALAAGKDIYIEKPLCRTPQEGVEMVLAEKNSKSVVQVGMQRRSYGLYYEARDIWRGGELGSVRLVRTYWLNNDLSPVNRDFEGALDWDQWLGPMPRRPRDPSLFFAWRHFSEFSGGIVMDQGAHIYDSIHMVMDAGYPSAVTASSGEVRKPGVDQPATWVVTAEYPQGFLAVFTINYAAMKYPSAIDQLNSYDGDKARMDLGREFLRVYPLDSPEKPSIDKEEPGGFGLATAEHVKNFLECVRTRATPNAPTELGFQSALVLQMANLSARQGRRIKWNANALQIET